MTAKTKDWARTGTIVAYAEYLRASSDALAVIVVRRDDSALAADKDLAPLDVKALVVDHLIDLVEDLAKSREEKRKAARRELEPLHE